VCALPSLTVHKPNRSLLERAFDRPWHNQPVPLYAAANIQPAHSGNTNPATWPRKKHMFDINFIDIILAVEVIGLIGAGRFWYCCQEKVAAAKRAQMLRIKARS
jgi:hypothetical protein